jgi:hypothetical protein
MYDVLQIPAASRCLQINNKEVESLKVRYPANLVFLKPKGRCNHLREAKNGFKNRNAYRLIVSLRKHDNSFF